MLITASLLSHFEWMLTTAFKLQVNYMQNKSAQRIKVRDFNRLFKRKMMDYTRKKK